MANGNSKAKPKDNTKLARLPQDAKVHKRPLHRPAIPSKYAGHESQKVVYVSARTPFLSAIKKVEKLLKFADKRLVQSATDIAKQDSQRGFKRKRGGPDEILDIATEVERQKAGAKRRKTGKDGTEDPAMEEVVIKGAGKAIARVMEMGLWFQERSDEYKIRLETGNVATVDDIEAPDDEAAEGLPESRIRYMSVLQVFVSLR